MHGACKRGILAGMVTDRGMFGNLKAYTPKSVVPPVGFRLGFGGRELDKSRPDNTLGIGASTRVKMYIQLGRLTLRTTFPVLLKPTYLPTYYYLG